MADGKFIISYVHAKKGVFHQATLSEINKQYHLTWTVIRSTGQKNKSGPLTATMFRFFWNTILDLPVFQQSIPADPQTQVDPSVYHVIAIAYETENGEKGTVTYLVPTTERDPAFQNWLKTLSDTYTTLPSNS